MAAIVWFPLRTVDGDTPGQTSHNEQAEAIQDQKLGTVSCIKRRTASLFHPKEKSYKNHIGDSQSFKLGTVEW